MSSSLPCVGLVVAAAELDPKAQWQRCMVHWYRNALSRFPRMDEVARMLKAIHARENRKAALKKVQDVQARLREIRRRTRVVGAFPDGQSCLVLAAARLRHITGTKGSSIRYLDMTLLEECDLEEPETENDELTA